LGRVRGKALLTWENADVRSLHDPQKKATSKVNGISTRRLKVEPGGTGVVARVGLHAVGTFADRLGLGDALSVAVSYRGPGVPAHDRGKVLTQVALMLAGGGEACLDIEHLRAGVDLFGSVPSDTTVARTFAEITEADRAQLAAAVAPLRAKVWETSNTFDGDGPVMLDIDASLIELHSENKDRTAATFKGGFGFHPMFCFADGTGDTLAAILRPDNAGSLKASITKCFSGATWQRYRVNFAWNLLAAVPKADSDMVSAAFRSIFAHRDPDAIVARWDEVTDLVAPRLPKTAELMRNARDDVLAFRTFPKAHWRKIGSNNPLERLNTEIKRRSRVVGIFPNDGVVIRLIGAVLADQHDEWAITRRYLSEGSMALIDNPTQGVTTNPAPNELTATSAAEAPRITPALPPLHETQPSSAVARSAVSYYIWDGVSAYDEDRCSVGPPSNGCHQ
jgi:hypothetical protein